jgi:hypothetical protein
MARCRQPQTYHREGQRLARDLDLEAFLCIAEMFTVASQWQRVAVL